MSSKYTLLGWNGSTDVLLPPKNRTCEFPRIRLKLLWPLGKRFAVAKLTASLAYRLEPSFDRASLLAALFRHPLSKSAPASLSSLPCGRAGFTASYLSPISPGTLKGEPSLFGSSSAQCPPVFWFPSHWVYLVHRLTPWQQEKAILCYTPVISCLPRHANSHRVSDHIPLFERVKPTHPSSRRCGSV